MKKNIITVAIYAKSLDDTKYSYIASVKEQLLSSYILEDFIVFTEDLLVKKNENLAVFTNFYLGFDSQFKIIFLGNKNEITDQLRYHTIYVTDDIPEEQFDTNMKSIREILP